MSDEAARILGQTNFSAIDWAIVAGYLTVSVVIGLLVRNYVSDMASYITAGRSLGTALGVATMTGTELGLITVMYSAEKGFKGGFAAFHIAVLAGLVTFLVGLTGFIVAELRKHEVLTIPEFYERRFGRSTRVMGGVMLAFAGILNMGLFLKVGSMFLVGVTGMSANSFALPAVMTTLLVLVLFYTVLGGMISVVLTDYIQFVVLSLGLIVTTLLLVARLGWNDIFDTVETVMGERGFNPVAAESSFGWDYVLWMGVVGLVGCAVWPTAVARALAMDSPQAVRRQYMWSSLSFLIRFLIPYFWGICALVFIMTQSPELQAWFFPETTGAENAETISGLYATPIVLGRLLPTGLLGIISAGMIAAFMSTHDSYLLCWSSVITQDIVAPLTGDRLSTRARIRLTRTFIVLIGLWVLAWGLFYTGRDDIWDYMAITGAIYFTGAIPLLVGGLYWRGASRAGANLALLAGFSAILGLGPVRHLLQWDEVSGARIGLISVTFTALVFVLGSILLPDGTRPLGDSSQQEQAR